MRLAAFRIRNFRSIQDSDWVPFSMDGITVLVGQNESGKSSVLEALHFSLSRENPTPDDFRIGADLPEVSLRLEIDPAALSLDCPELPEPIADHAKTYLERNKNLIEITWGWQYGVKEGKRVLEAYADLSDQALVDGLAHALLNVEQSSEGDSTTNDAGVTSTPIQPSADIVQSDLPSTREDLAEELTTALVDALPLSVLFNEESGRLPNQVDIDDKGRPSGEGARAALNFLQIADIDLPALLKGDRRARENTLNRANSRVSDDFNKFWSQTIGKIGRLTLKCDLDNYSAAVPEKAGKPHLVFWICDGTTQLYPKQRSQGVRWFLSFYLQLKASEKARNRRVFLLDEPGANLHSKAQGDVLKLINQLGKDTSTVVYSTHSPQMLEYSKLYRVHAIQRAGDLDESPTVIIDAHRLGTASTDTLSPVLTAMGADLSQHQVVRKTNNVLLEEMSAYYYLTSFWRLAGMSKEVHFIAATGVNKIESMANMFRGWGLSFIVAIDDDKQGREVYKSMKRELFGDEDQLASQNLLKFPGCPSIEDAFSKDDFAQFVVNDDVTAIKGTNGEYMKSASRSKPVVAFQFALAVEKGAITMQMLNAESQQRIRTIVEAIASRLN